MIDMELAVTSYELSLFIHITAAVASPQARIPPLFFQETKSGRT